ncbi:NfeD family protein [Thermorudis peleae]|uniref:NfeD family protein n=1 Tax=Thermorudis peleae TaxID=1382356 RepID=UPI0009DED523|nr:nodulation protein NfeD [Thermorudis peleae]
MRTWHLRLGLFFFSLLCLLTYGPSAYAQDPPSRVALLHIDGAITPMMANYLHRGLQQAQREQVNAIVVQMNTPGGLSSAMDDIVTDFLQSPIPVIVYVAPPGARAASAGVFITYAAHIAAMAPTTNIGSASPVFLGPSGEATSPDQTMRQKVVNDAVAKIRNLATLRGRNADWAEQAVREAVNITADQALQLHVIDLIAPTLPDLLAQVDGRVVKVATGEVVLHTRDAQVIPISMSLSERFFQLLTDPNIAYILLSLGMLGLFFELANPGGVLPGIIGGILLLLGLFALGNLDANWTGVLLMAFAFLLFLADVYFPTHGALTVGGIIAFALGSFLLLSSPASPVFQVSRLVIATVVGLISGLFVLVVVLVAHVHTRQPTTGREALIDQIAVVREKLDPEGMVFVMGELWRARSINGPVNVGERVRVVAVEGLTLLVTPELEVGSPDHLPTLAPASLERGWRPLARRLMQSVIGVRSSRV